MCDDVDRSVQELRSRKAVPPPTTDLDEEEQGRGKLNRKKLEKSFLEKAQMYMCGYDLRMNTPTGMKKDDPKRSQWTFFESIFPSADTNGIPALAYSLLIFLRT